MQRWQQTGQHKVIETVGYRSNSHRNADERRSSGLQSQKRGALGMAFIDNVLDRIGRVIARRLRNPSSGYEPFTSPDPDILLQTL